MRGPQVEIQKKLTEDHRDEVRGGTYSIGWGAIQTGANHRVERSPSAETRDSLLGNIFGRIFFIKNFLNCGESFLSNCRWESEIWNLA